MIHCCNLTRKSCNTVLRNNKTLQRGRQRVSEILTNRHAKWCDCNPEIRDLKICNLKDPAFGIRLKDWLLFSISTVVLMDLFHAQGA